MNEETNSTKVIRDASAESILAEMTLEEKLKKSGDLCAYAVLKSALGKDPTQRPTYGYVMTARRRFENKHGCVLDVVPNEGIKWLTPEDVIVMRAERDKGHIKRSAKSAGRRQRTTLSTTDLPQHLLKRRNENLAQIGVLEMFSKPSAQRKIAEHAATSGKLLNAGEVLEHFQKV